MRTLLIVGSIVLLLGIASLFVPIPRRERHGIEAGPISLGVETTTRNVVHPGISAVLIGAGVVLLFAGRRKK
jgi:hypothetical protein